MPWKWVLVLYLPNQLGQPLLLLLTAAETGPASELGSGRLCEITHTQDHKVTCKQCSWVFVSKGRLRVVREPGRMFAISEKSSPKRIVLENSPLCFWASREEKNCKEGNDTNLSLKSRVLASSEALPPNAVVAWRLLY